MIGGFLKSQHTLLNLSGNTAAIGTLQTGSSIVGISIVGNPYTNNNDIPINWTGSYDDFSYLQLNENEVIKDVGPKGTRLWKSLYTLETPSGSLTLDEDEYIMVAQKNQAIRWDEETETTSSFQDGWNVFFEQLDGLEWGNASDYDNHYLVRLKEDNSTFEYVPITDGVQEVNEDEPLAGLFDVRSLDVEESDLFMVNRFVVHNFFNGDDECTVQYNNVPRCSGYGPASFAFEDTRPNNVMNFNGTCYNFSGRSASFPDGTALCLSTEEYNWYSNCSTCQDSDSSTGPQGAKGQKGEIGIGPQGNQGSQGSTGNQGAQGASGGAG